MSATMVGALTCTAAPVCAQSSFGGGKATGGFLDSGSLGGGSSTSETHAPTPPKATTSNVFSFDGALPEIQFDSTDNKTSPEQILSTDPVTSLLSNTRNYLQSGLSYKDGRGYARVGSQMVLSGSIFATPDPDTPPGQRTSAQITDYTLTITPGNSVRLRDFDEIVSFPERFVAPVSSAKVVGQNLVFSYSGDPFGQISYSLPTWLATEVTKDDPNFDPATIAVTVNSDQEGGPAELTVVPQQSSSGPRIGDAPSLGDGIEVKVNGRTNQLNGRLFGSQPQTLVINDRLRSQFIAMLCQDAEREAIVHVSVNGEGNQAEGLSFTLYDTDMYSTDFTSQEITGVATYRDIPLPVPVTIEKTSAGKLTVSINRELPVGTLLTLKLPFGLTYTGDDLKRGELKLSLNSSNARMSEISDLDDFSVVFNPNCASS